MNKIKMFLCAVTFIAGCSANSGPSNAEVEDAVRANFNTYNEQVKAMEGGMFGNVEVAVHGVKSLGCKSAISANGYTCDVEVDATVPMAGRSKGVSEIHLVKAASGWQVVQKH